MARVIDDGRVAIQKPCKRVRSRVSDGGIEGGWGRALMMSFSSARFLAGQLIGYPLMDLKRCKLGVREYVELVEATIVRSRVAHRATSGIWRLPVYRA